MPRPVPAPTAMPKKYILDELTLRLFKVECNLKHLNPFGCKEMVFCVGYDFLIGDCTNRVASPTLKLNMFLYGQQNVILFVYFLARAKHALICLKLGIV